MKAFDLVNYLPVCCGIVEFILSSLENLATREKKVKTLESGLSEGNDSPEAPPFLVPGTSRPVNRPILSPEQQSLAVFAKRNPPNLPQMGGGHQTAHGRLPDADLAQALP